MDDVTLGAHLGGTEMGKRATPDLLLRVLRLGGAMSNRRREVRQKYSKNKIKMIIYV